MKSEIKRSLLGVALAFAFTGTAVATPITFTFNSTGTPQASYSQLNAASNVSVTVTAASTNGPSEVTLNGNPGLGVRQVQGGGSNTIDANGSRIESLLFSFTQAFSLTSFALSSASAAESFIFSWGVGAQSLGSESLIPIGSTSVTPYVVLDSVVGDWFMISGARDGSTQSNFYVQNLTVDVAPASTSSVPEPASTLLLALGLGGLALLRRARAA